MSKNIYLTILKLISPYSVILLFSVLAAIIYVIFNSLSIWLTASLINNILTDFDQLLLNQKDLSNQVLSLNDKLKYWTNQFILRDTAYETIKVLCFTILFVFIIKNIFLYFKNIGLTYVQFNLITKIRNDLYNHFHKLSLSFFDQKKSGELTSIVVTDVANMRVALGASFHKLIVEPINILMFVFLLFVINIKLAIYAIAIIPITGFIILSIGSSIRRKSRRTAKKIAKIMGIITEILNSVRVVKAYGTEEYEKNRFFKEQNNYYQLILNRAKLRLITTPVTEIIGASIGVSLLWIGGQDVLIAGTMSSEDFIRFILILFSVFGPIRLLSNVNVNLQAGMASAERVFDILDTRPQITESSNALSLNEIKDEVRFKNVFFNYDNGPNILSNISFSIPKGQLVAIIGSSGAGKSTIADLIPRFYDVVKGSIEIDSVNLKKIKISSLRNLMGIVNQEVILFDETIEFNIGYGARNYLKDDLIKASKAANAYNFILNQPDGFKTIIGENGTKLSGGQKQRIAIARAILRNPSLLLLDEATSSLDSKSELKVQSALKNLMKNRTTLVIAHRLSTIKKADNIIVLDKGKIIESGNHEILFKANGLYRTFYEQFSQK